MHRSVLAVLVGATFLGGCGDGSQAPPCAEGADCTPSSACKRKAISCASGSAVCAETGTSVPDGTACGSALVCRGGACITACAANQLCQPANPCTTGLTSCQAAHSEPTCVVTSNKPDETACGSGNVCRGGSCVPPACTPNAPCQPANPCSTGAMSCASLTTPGVCTTIGSKPDATVCGTGLTCLGGTCIQACVAGLACPPSDPCRTGTTACATPISRPTCSVSGNVEDGTSCGDGLVCHAGICDQAHLAIQLTEPASAVITNGSIGVVVTLSGDPPDRVDLLVDGAPVMQLHAPYVAAYDTRALSEGTHELSARATLGSTTFTSETRSLVVDRTPPQVVTLVPAPASTNVWSRDPVTVEFSEPMKPSSVVDAAIVVTSNTGSALTKTLSLASGGRILTIQTNTLPPVPNTLTVTFTTALTDEAGNALQLPQGSWSWDLPAWQLFEAPLPIGGGSANVWDPISTMDASGRLTVLSYRYKLGESENHLYQWRGDSMDLLAGTDLAGLAGIVRAIDATDDGWVALAYYNSYEGMWPQGILLRLFNGTQWGPPRLVPSTADFFSARVKVRFDYRGEVVVSLGIPDGAGYPISVYRSAGSVLEQLGIGPAVTLSTSDGWSLSIDQAGAPVIAYSSETLGVGHATWNGTSWVTTHLSSLWPAGSTYFSRPVYASSGEVYVARRELNVAGSPLHVLRAAPSMMWVEDLGIPCSNCRLDGLAQGQTELPVVAWMEGKVICARRWTGTAWIQLEADGPCTGVAGGLDGFAMASPGGPTSLTVSACYAEQAYSGNHTVCGRYNR